MSVDSEHSRYLNLIVKRLIESFHPQKVLDAGCGKGELVNVFQKYGVEIYGKDISKQSLYHAKDVVQDALLCQADAEIIPFKDDIFDLVTSEYVQQDLLGKNV